MGKKHTKLLILITTLLLSMLRYADAGGFEHYEFKNRLLIVDLTRVSAKDKIKATISQHERQLTDRKLVIFTLTDETVLLVIGADTSHSAVTVSTVKELLNNHQAALIGLDGGLKARYNDFDLTQIFDDIDKMPMRRAEMH